MNWQVPVTDDEIDYSNFTSAMLIRFAATNDQAQFDQDLAERSERWPTIKANYIAVGGYA